MVKYDGNRKLGENCYVLIDERLWEGFARGDLRQTLALWSCYSVTAIRNARVFSPTRESNIFVSRATFAYGVRVFQFLQLKREKKRKEKKIRDDRNGVLRR